MAQIKKINPQQEIAKGFDEAKEFLNSKVREDAFKHNIELARRAGFKDFDEMSAYRDADRLSTPANVSIINDRAEGYMGMTRRSRYPASDQIRINLAYGKKHIKDTAFHKALHRGFYGQPFWTNDATRKFYQWKSNKLKLPWNKQPHILPWNKDYREYINSPEEMAVQMKEFGKQLGIPSGAKYLGDAQFRKMLRDYRIRNWFSNNDKSQILSYLNMKKPKRIWDALSGQYFSAPLVVGGAATLSNQSDDQSTQ